MRNDAKTVMLRVRMRKSVFSIAEMINRQDLPMFFFNGKEDLGLDACLALLGLTHRATIDEANQAYASYHRMIDLFHRDNHADQNDRQEDLEFLACAYEKAVSYLSDPNLPLKQEPAPAVLLQVDEENRSAADLHFTLTVADAAEDASSTEEIKLVENPGKQTVENAVSIISRRLQEAEVALAEAREAVEVATTELDKASKRLEKNKKARLEAEIVAEAASSRAVLLDIEAQRATEEAIIVAQKVRDKLNESRQVGKKAKLEADKARDRIKQFTSAEETAAAEAVCAQDRLEKAKKQLKSITHVIVEARSQLRMFEDYGNQTGRLRSSKESEKTPPKAAAQGEGQAGEREKMMADLLEIENALTTRKKSTAASTAANRQPQPNVIADVRERREHERLYYLDEVCPTFSFEGEEIPVLDLSQSGMRLDSDTIIGKSNLVRGELLFEDLPSMKIAGRIMHQNEQGVGLRLVTRIGNHILDQERRRLCA